VRAPIKVLLAQQDRLMFEGLMSVLSEHTELDLVGVATSAADAVEKSLVLKPDVVVMDVRLSDSDGAHACERIRNRMPDVAVLFLSADVSGDSMERAVMAGAAGYLSSDVSTTELVNAIQKLADGEMLVTASTLARMLRGRQAPSFEEDSPAPAGPLSKREREVLTRLALAMPNADIAAELETGPAEVRGHVRAVLEKLGVHSRTQAVEAARRAGLVGEGAEVSR
jgi:two-component system, NarL family, response regulator DevR